MMELSDYRRQIDEIDAELVRLFERRMDVSAGIAEVKRERNLPICDPAREREKLTDVASRVREDLAEDVCALYRTLFALSRAHQHALICARNPSEFTAYLLGERLGHSFSKRIHAMLGDYRYDYREIAPDALDAFMREEPFDALNVTLPYKRAVMPYCAELTNAARDIGSVNTIVRRADGTLRGDNTDAAGFAYLLRRMKLDPNGMHALVLGSGGASRTAQYVLKSMGARVTVISRTGDNNYENIERHADARLLVNATPVGMYPRNGECPVDLDRLPKLTAVLDLIYNPARTRLLLSAAERGICASDGLYMLVEQARAASERFMGRTIPQSRTEEIYRVLRADMQNIILIGMPGCGKSSVGRAIADVSGREFFDADDELERALRMPVCEYLRTHTEAEFRAAETEVLRGLGKKSHAVIATGGGCVTRAENHYPLCQNGKILFLRRDIHLLPTEGRPLSQAEPIEALYARRLPLYRAFADAEIDNDGTIKDAAARAAEVYNEIACD